MPSRPRAITPYSSTISCRPSDPAAACRRSASSWRRAVWSLPATSTGAGPCGAARRNAASTAAAAAIVGRRRHPAVKRHRRALVRERLGGIRGRERQPRRGAELAQAVGRAPLADRRDRREGEQGARREQDEQRELGPYAHARQHADARGGARAGDAMWASAVRRRLLVREPILCLAAAGVGFSLPQGERCA